MIRLLCREAVFSVSSTQTVFNTCEYRFQGLIPELLVNRDQLMLDKNGTSEPDQIEDQQAIVGGLNEMIVILKKYVVPY